MPVKSDFLPVKKTKKLPVKIKKVGVKKLKNGPKSGREKRKLPVKKIKKTPKIGFHGHFFFHGEKKTLLQDAFVSQTKEKAFNI